MRASQSWITIASSVPRTLNPATQICDQCNQSRSAACDRLKSRTLWQLRIQAPMVLDRSARMLYAVACGAYMRRGKTHCMKIDPALAAEILHIETSFNKALVELQALFQQGAKTAPMLELAQHARELLDLLNEALARLGDGDIADELRATASAMDHRLQAILRDLADIPLH
jgi:hypothetical protein